MADAVIEKPREEEVVVVEKPKEVKLSWGDIVDDEETTASTSEDKSLTPDMEALKIEEDKPTHKFLDDPEDSNIKAVTLGDTLYSTAKKFEDLSISDDLIKGLYVEMKFER